MSDTHDIINHPPHYTATAIEPIDVIEAWDLDFHLGQVIKYVARAEHKGRYLEDLKKAQWYLTRKIANEDKIEQEMQQYRDAVIAEKQAKTEVPDLIPDPRIAGGSTADEEPYTPAVNAAKAAFQGLFRFSTQGDER